MADKKTIARLKECVNVMLDQFEKEKMIGKAIDSMSIARFNMLMNFHLKLTSFKEKLDDTPTYTDMQERQKIINQLIEKITSLKDED